MCKDQLCVRVKHAKFLMYHMPIFDQCTNKYIHNARVFIILIVKTFFGGKLEGLGGGGGGGGGSFSPAPPSR